VDVTGVAGTSVNWCGVYGQTGEILQSERSFPQHITTGVFLATFTPFKKPFSGADEASRC
jgi:hypothetical protein